MKYSLRQIPKDTTRESIKAMTGQPLSARRRPLTPATPAQVLQGGLLPPDPAGVQGAAYQLGEPHHRREEVIK
jgi:hypothetical protein